MSTTYTEALPDNITGSRQLAPEAVKTFIAKVKQVERSNPQAAEELAQNFYGDHLSMSPSDVVMSAPDMLDLLAEAREVKSLQSTLAHNLVGELGYQFGFADSDYFMALAERVMGQTPEDGIESMAMYRDILEDTSNVTVEAALHATAGLEMTFGAILDDTSLPAFSHMVAQATRDSLRTVSQNPERGFVRMSNDVNGGKFVAEAERTQLKKESVDLGKKFESVADGRATFLTRISSDMVAVTDHAGTPLQLARLSEQDERSAAENPLEFRVIADLNQVSWLLAEEVSPAALLSRVCEVMRAFPNQTSRLVPEQVGLDGVSVRELFEAYDEYITVSAEIRQLENDARSEAEDACLEETKKTLRVIAGDTALMQLISSDEHTNKTFEEGRALASAGNEYGYEMMLRAYESATSMVRIRGLMDAPESTDGQSLYDYDQDLHEKHEKIHKRVNEEFEQTRATLIEKSEQGTALLEAYLGEVWGNWPEFQQAVAEACEEITRQYDSLQFVPVDEIEISNRKMFQVIHETYVRNKFSQIIGFALEELPLHAQDRAIRYMLGANQTTFLRLQQALGERITTSEKIALFEAFTATEFGDDLGDIILEVAEKDAPRGVSSEIFKSISDIRTALGAWGQEVWFNNHGSGFEGYFNGIQRSIEERISDILSPLPDLLGNQAVTASFYKGKEADGPVEVSSIEQVVQDLCVLQLAIDKIVGSEQGVYGDNTIRPTDTVARFESMDSAVAVSVRPETSTEGEARVAWTVKITPEEQEQIYGQVLEYTASGKPKNGTVTIRVDLEDTTHGLSLDIGSSNSTQVINYRLATAVSAGAQHLAARRGEEVVGRDYHVRNHFDADLARPDRFRKWALWMRHNTEIWHNKRTGNVALRITPHVAHLA